MILQQLGLEDATAAREEGMARADANADVLWREGVDRAIRWWAGTGMAFTADRVREMAGDPPPGFSPNAMGSAFSRAAKAGIIKQSGYAISSRAVGHGNLVRRWIGNASS